MHFFRYQKLVGEGQTSGNGQKENSYVSASKHILIKQLDVAVGAGMCSLLLQIKSELYSKLVKACMQFFWFLKEKKKTI